MSLPIRLILWAGNDSNHRDHLHVEGEPKRTGTPPLTNPGKTVSVERIYQAMNEGYGNPYYFRDSPPNEPNWSHMGWYNRRKIAGTNIWSQHAWSNALDIGPLIGVNAQAPIYHYLTNYTPPPPEDETMLKIGDTGFTVTEIQKGLNHWPNRQGPELTVDGNYGPATAAAVTEYQAACDLPTSGNVDGLTLAMLTKQMPWRYGHPHKITIT